MKTTIKLLLMLAINVQCMAQISISQAAWKTLPRSYSITGMLRNDSDLAIQYGRVDVLDGSVLVATTVTDSTGHYYVNELPDGMYILRANSLTLKRSQKRIFIKAWRRKWLVNFKLKTSNRWEKYKN